MKISFVIPCYRSEKTLPDVIDEIKSTMAEIGHEFEIILVNDSSPDNTFEVIKKLASENDNILGIDLAKNFGQHCALMAGMRHSSGDVVVCLDDDGQTPANEVGKLLGKLDEGFDVSCKNCSIVISPVLSCRFTSANPSFFTVSSPFLLLNSLFLYG